jgi:hypothetical protein
LSLASPPDRASAPLLCLYGDASRSETRFVPPDGVETVETAATDALDALADPRLAGRDVVLLQHGTRLPPQAWERLVRAAAATPGIDVLSPMGAGLALDARCLAVSDRVVVPATTWSRRFSYWRAPRAATTAGVLDHLCIDDDEAESVESVVARARDLGEIELPRHGFDGRPVVLHVLHGWGGGAQRFVEDLAHADRERHHLVLVARGDARRKRHGEALELRAGLPQPA